MKAAVFYVDGMRVDAQFLQNQLEANEAAARFDQLYDGGENYPDYYGGAYLGQSFRPPGVFDLRRFGRAAGPLQRGLEQPQRAV